MGTAEHPPVAWAIEPSSDDQAPLVLSTGKGRTRILVDNDDLEALLGVVAAELLAQARDLSRGGLGGREVPPLVRYLRRWAEYNIGDHAWADDLLARMADDEETRERMQGVW